jgi:RNA-binding protein
MVKGLNRGKSAYFGAMVSLTNAQIRLFKAQAQRLKATLKVGKEGLSPQSIAALDDALKHHELVKVKFDDHKEQKKELAPQLSSCVASEEFSDAQVGHMEAASKAFDECLAVLNYDAWTNKRTQPKF